MIQYPWNECLSYILSYQFMVYFKARTSKVRTSDEVGSHHHLKDN